MTPRIGADAPVLVAHARANPARPPPPATACITGSWFLRTRRSGARAPHRWLRREERSDEPRRLGKVTLSAQVSQASRPLRGTSASGRWHAPQDLNQLSGKDRASAAPPPGSGRTWPTRSSWTSPALTPATPRAGPPRGARSRRRARTAPAASPPAVEQHPEHRRHELLPGGHRHQSFPLNARDWSEANSRPSCWLTRATP